MNETIRIRSLSIPRLGSADLPEFATPEARAAFRTRQTKNFGDFDELIDRTPELAQDIDGKLSELDTLLAGREHVDADDFVLYPSLRMLSIVRWRMAAHAKCLSNPSGMRNIDMFHQTYRRKARCAF